MDPMASLANRLHRATVISIEPMAIIFSMFTSATEAYGQHDYNDRGNHEVVRKCRFSFEEKLNNFLIFVIDSLGKSDMACNICYVYIYYQT